MTYGLCLLLVLLVLGMIGIASNPTPYYAILGLVTVAGVGCGIMIGCGGSFLSLILFLIYLGGMLVVFAYSAALSAEPFPEAWGGRFVVLRVAVYILAVGAVAEFFCGNWYEGSLVVVDSLKEFSIIRGDVGGVAVMYSWGGGMLVTCAWVLLLTLFVVLEVTRGLSCNVLRAV
uniref:NADH-ubiquinone oxidoreductase chain 6 n=1 Tax=Devario devario TaxID=46781 RepID=A0A1E1FMY9_DEVDE|nr:NADH dehydrogenase subunit 6 [Devario devario]BAV71872.1 NADH dehydrogenase subunit 6 [Devario devario]